MNVISLFTFEATGVTSVFEQAARVARAANTTFLFHDKHKLKVKLKNLFNKLINNYAPTIMSYGKY